MFVRKDKNMETNSEKLIRLMKSYLDEENYDYALYIEILNKLNRLDDIERNVNNE